LPFNSLVAARWFDPGCVQDVGETMPADCRRQGFSAGTQFNASRNPLSQSKETATH
jgi:hypothetical protein